MNLHSPRKARRRRELAATPTGMPSDGKPSRAASDPTMFESLYSDQYSPDEREAFEFLRAGDLSAEISMLRVAIRRVFQTASATSAGVSDEDQTGAAIHWMEALDKLGMASSRLAGLLRTQHMLQKSGQDEVATALSQALAELTKEMKLE